MMDEIKEKVKHTSIGSILLENFDSKFLKLISKPSFQNIYQFSANIPRQFSSFFGYEIQLSNDENKADFLLCIHNFKVFYEVISNEIFIKKFDKETAEGLQCFANWMFANKGTAQTICNIWIEIDHGDLATTQPKLNFFLGPKTNTNKLEILLATEQTFKLLYNKQVAATTLKLLLEIYSKLRNQSFISQIGMMNARNNESLRLFIQKIDREDFLPLLNRIEYKYITDNQLVKLINICLQNTKHTDLDIDILEKVKENIGLECYFDTIKQAILFLQLLFKEKLCTLDNYINLTTHLTSMSIDEDGDFQHFFSHFKISYKPSIGADAKAYIGYAESKIAHKIIETKPLNQRLA
ncbi:MAG: hypothetical protein V4683_15060 [Bacteroidota bacterium]